MALALKVELYLSSSWTDVTADVLSAPGIRMSRGIDGVEPKDRVAKTGTLSFSLDNSAGNSGGKLGYYSPDNSNLRTGFGIGTRARLSMSSDNWSTTYYRFHGRINSIIPEPGQKGPRSVRVEAVDYMDYLAAARLKGLAVQTSKRADEIIDAIVDALPIAPLATSYATGPDSFPYALHVEEDEKTTAMNAIQKTVQSDLGYLFVKGDTTGGETLTYQTRHTRLIGNALDVTLTDDMIGLDVTHKTDTIQNDVRVTVYPVRVDAAATTVLATIQEEFSVGPGTTVTKTLIYRDPTGADTRVSGTSMVDPVAGTDYEFTATSGSGNSDMNGSVTVTAVFGGNSAELTIANTHGYKTVYSGGAETFQVRGKGIYTYDAVEAVQEDSTSQTAYGARTLVYNLPYQNNTNVGDAFALEFLRRYKDPATRVRSVRFNANRSTTLLTAGMTLDIGDRVKVVETVTGLSDEYFINAVDYDIKAPNILFVSWLLEPRIETGAIGVWGTNAGDSGIWGTNASDSTVWTF